MTLLTGSAFDVQLVRRGFSPKALKRRNKIVTSQKPSREPLFLIKATPEMDREQIKDRIIKALEKKGIKVKRQPKIH